MSERRPLPRTPLRIFPVMLWSKLHHCVKSMHDPIWLSSHINISLEKKLCIKSFVASYRWNTRNFHKFILYSRLSRNVGGNEVQICDHTCIHHTACQCFSCLSPFLFHKWLLVRAKRKITTPWDWVDHLFIWSSFKSTLCRLNWYVLGHTGQGAVGSSSISQLQIKSKVIIIIFHCL